MSKRAPIIVIGLIVLLLLVAPYGLGSLAESSVTRQIEAMAANPAVAIEIQEYDRGWFSSRATIEVTPSNAYMQNSSTADPMVQMMLNQLRAPFEVELGHGPILTLNGFGIGGYAVLATLDPATEWVQMAMTNLDVPYVFQLRGRSGFGSGFRFDGDVPSFEMTAQGQTVSFSGLIFSGHTDGRDLTFESSSDRLTLQSTFMNLSLEGLGLHGDVELNPGRMSLGSGQLVIDRFIAINPLLGTDAVISLIDLGISASTGLNEVGNIDYGVVYEAGSMTFEGSPEFSDVALGITLMNLDYAAFEQLYELSSQSSAAGDPTMLAVQVLPLIDQIVAAGPGISFNPVRLSMEGGDLAATLNATIDPAALPTGQAMALADPTVLTAAVSADLEMTVSKDMLVNLVAMSLRAQFAAAMPTATETQLETISKQQAEQTIQGIVAQGMLTEEGNAYSTTIMVENGIATVNGTPIPLGELGLF
jgi:uncharacterized protein YdgA (DUF945 family)